MKTAGTVPRSIAATATSGRSFKRIGHIHKESNPMTKIDDYRQQLKKLKDWIPFLKKESGLPGPRGNLELAHAVAREGSKQQYEHLLSVRAEENTPEVFLVFCGVIGLGRLAACEPELFAQIRGYASDTRWRVREAVAAGLQ